MSRAENRHHRRRVIKNRVRQVKAKWHRSARDTEWLHRTVRFKDNPFTRCSCEMCQESESNRANNRRCRKEAKRLVQEDMP